jgi:(R,R)-butanediol dehydrogenase / meso-butanediol dehydrogenase / diacetyl reductase
MKAAQFNGTNPGVSIVNVAKPEIGDEEALVKVLFTGICGSDPFHVSGQNPRVRNPLIPGHEFSGVIEDIKSKNTSFQSGNRVTAFPPTSCGHCEACLSGHYQLCRPLTMIGTQLNGALAEYVVVPVPNLILLSDSLNMEHGALIEPLAVAMHGVRLSRPEIGDAALVIGGGPIGLFTAQLLRLSGCHPVIVSEISPSRRNLAEGMGFSLVDPMDRSGVEQVIHRTGSRGFDIVIECVGHPSTIESIITMGAMRSRVVIVGAFHEPAAVDIFNMSKKEQTLIPSWQYERDDFRRVAALLAANILNLEGIISHRFKLDEADKAITIVRDAGDSLKVLVQIF